jgi:hypothetical protein
MQEETDLKVFEEEMLKVIHDSYLSFPTDDMFDFFSGKSQNFYEQSGRNFNGKNAFFNENARYGTGFQAADGRYGEYVNNRGFYGDGNGFEFDGKVDRNRIKFCFFFGDNKKIKMLIHIIDSKLFLLMKNRLQQGQQGNIGKSGFESK